jgi:hypothetical protein
MAYEHICATSVYYHDAENITHSMIIFYGRAILGPCSYNQCYYWCLQHVFGTGLYQATAVQELSMALNRRGRLLAFPSIFQHEVQPFELADKAKPGHRKMVMLWLVNQQKRITSTVNIPPQQERAYTQHPTKQDSRRNCNDDSPGESGQSDGRRDTRGPPSVDGRASAERRRVPRHPAPIHFLQALICS